MSKVFRNNLQKIYYIEVWQPTRWRPFRQALDLLDSVLRALWGLRPCDPGRNHKSPKKSCSFETNGSPVAVSFLRQWTHGHTDEELRILVVAFSGSWPHVRSYSALSSSFILQLLKQYIVAILNIWWCSRAERWTMCTMSKQDTAAEEAWSGQELARWWSFESQYIFKNCKKGISLLRGTDAKASKKG